MYQNFENNRLKEEKVQKITKRTRKFTSRIKKIYK